MNVLNVASPLSVVSRDAPDGIERIIASVDHALVEAGHTSLVIAAEGSSIDGMLLDIPPASEDQSADKRAMAAQVMTRAILAETLETMRIDVVHFHGLDALGYMPDAPVPMLVTLHHPITWYAPELFQRKLHFTCVSLDQQSSLPALIRNSGRVSVIQNGVDTQLFAPIPRKHDYVAAIGSVTPERGFHLALEAARLARVPFQLAGAVSPHPTHQLYFRDSILPRLDAERIFIGPLVGLRRRAFLARARALVVPNLVDATSSVVAMEALACGTPVIAMRRGALPELIDDGTTGFLVDGFLELAEALQHVDSLSREACRNAALDRFDVRDTASAYLTAYARLAGVAAPVDDARIAKPAIARKS
jgi:glycosyltransferase involved in cell wall biosynthesis